MLVPHVTVNAFAHALDNGHYNIWSTVEISGHLKSPSSAREARSIGKPGGTPLAYGYLYDLKIHLQPMAHGRILDVINDAKR